MNTKCIVAFIAGAAVGAAAMYKMVKDTFKKKADDEIRSVIEEFTNKPEQPQTKSKEPTNPPMEKPETASYIDAAMAYKNPGVADKTASKPVIISNDDWCEKPNYIVVSWTYYSGSDTVVDELGDVVEDYAESIGVEFKTRFGEEEPDTVLIRNDQRHCYYEINRDGGEYEGGE